MKLQHQARFAGFLYLIMILTGMFSLAYIPSQLIVHNDPGQTFRNLQNNTLLFRTGIAAGMVCYFAYLFLALVLHNIFQAFNKTFAHIMVILAAIGVTISLLVLLHKYTILELISAKKYLEGFSPSELQSQVMLCLRNYNAGINIAELFWGTWLFPLGYMIYQSRYLPRIIGILLMLGCFGYLADAFGSTVFEDFYNLPGASYITLPATIGEVGTCLWLLIFGIKKQEL